MGQQQADGAGAVRPAAGPTSARTRKTRELYVQDLFAGADPGAPAERAHLHRVCLARAVHPPSAAPAAGRASWPASSRSSPSSTCRASGPTRSGTACARETVIACNFAKRLVLIGGTSYAGETKKSVFTYLNYADARDGRDADALLGQRRPGGRRGDVLRPVGHRQDDAVGRSQAHAARRRRARLVATTASTISRAAATPRPSACPRRPSPRSGPPPTASAPCWRTSSSIPARACPTSTTAA